MSNASLSMLLPSKRQKLLDIANDNEDRISMLPDSVLCHILLFLPIKDVVKTCIFSKRWANTWTSIGDLDIDDTSFAYYWPISSNNKQLFVNFVNRVLIRDSQFTINRLRLHLGIIYSNLNNWISAAIMRKVEEFDLFMQCYVVIQLPQLLFNCATIKVLKLHGKIDLQVPQSVYLPSLQVIHLERLQWLCDANIVRLLSGSPILEELLIDRDFKDNLQTLCVQSFSLKRFTFRSPCKTFQENSNHFGVVIDAPKLEFLELDDYSSQDYDFDMKNLSSIVTVLVNLYHRNVSAKYGDRAVRLLRQICDVKILRLSPYMLKALAHATDCYLPSFCNLTRLELAASGKKWLILPEILKCSFYLKVLKLSNQDYGARRYGDVPLYEAIFAEQVVPQCLKSCLEILEFKRFQANTTGMEMVEYFLKYALVLKEIRIFTLYFASTEGGSKLQKELSILPRASRTCRIQVV